MSPQRSLLYRPLPYPEQGTAEGAKEMLPIVARGRSQERPGLENHVETCRAVFPAAGSRDRARQIGPTDSRHSLSTSRFRFDCCPCPSRGLLLFWPKSARPRTQLGAELLHAAMQINEHRSVRHSSARCNFRAGHALDQTENQSLPIGLRQTHDCVEDFDRRTILISA